MAWRPPSAGTRWPAHSIASFAHAAVHSAHRAPVGKPERAGHREPTPALMFGSCASGRDDRLLKPAGRVEVVARPDQADGGGGGFAVGAIEVAPGCLAQARRRGPVVV